MADNKKYYYMRLNENYFDSEQQIVLESLPDGYLYSNILLKLYLKSLKRDGLLMFSERIPYNAQMIASITRHQIGTVEKALKLFVDMGIIEVMDSGAIYMLDIQKYVGESSTEADRIREYRQRIVKKAPNKLPAPADDGTNAGQMSEQTCTESVQNPYKCTTNVHQSIEYRDKSIEYRDKSIEYIGGECERGNAASADAEAQPSRKSRGSKKSDETRHTHGAYQNVLLSDTDLQKLQTEFPHDWQERIERLSEYIASKGAKYKSHIATIRAWARNDKQKDVKSPNYYLPNKSKAIGSETNF